MAAGLITREQAASASSDPAFKTETDTPSTEGLSIGGVEGNIGEILEELKNDTDLTTEQKDILKEQRKILAILKGDPNNYFILNGEDGIDEAKNWTLEEWVKKIENGEASWVDFGNYASQGVQNEFHLPRGGSSTPTPVGGSTKNELTHLSYYKKGGLVDYTGLAMVHGSNSSPEAFLNANQTEMFANLARTLGNISSGDISESINIENITIQTASLNNNQDFGQAGKALAQEFQKAINRRGITLNTKR